MKNIKYLLIFIVIFIAIVAFIKYAPTKNKPKTPETKQTKTTKNDVKRETEEDLVNTPLTTDIATGLKIPWSLVFISDDHLLFTEREGKVKIVNVATQESPIEVSGVPSVKAYGEGGLLGAELHPNFKSNKYIYLYYTYSSDGNNTLNRVSRFKLENNKLSDEKYIVDAIPGAIYHNGGRIKFGPDKLLYITTGDARVPSAAQDKNSLSGKILRVTDDGDAAPDNPFGNRIYSYGHRNPQGLAWDKDGDLWETEHGNSAHDEVNLIRKGKNYGWPTITGTQDKEGMETPIAQSGSGTWAPSGLVYLNNDLYFAGLRGSAIFRASPPNAQMRVNELFKNEYGRIRDIIIGPDGFIYFATNNRDGRGIAKSGDDKIVKVHTKLFLRM